MFFIIHEVEALVGNLYSKKKMLQGFHAVIYLYKQITVEII